MNATISDCGPVDDRVLDTLDAEVLPQVLSERGLDAATYSGYSYIRPKRVGIDACRLCAFGTGQEIGFRLIADNRTDRPAKVSFRVSVKDSAGKSVSEAARVEVAAAPRERAARRICFSLALNGTYTLVYKAQTEQRLFESKVEFAVVPPEDPQIAAASPFGLHAGHCRLLQAANMRWARNGQIVFAEQLSDQENRDWTTFDHVLHTAQRHDVSLIPVIQCNPTKQWRARPLADYTRFRSFVRDLVAQFRDRQTIWEFVNEPNHEQFSPEQYVEALRAGYEAAKEGDPNCTVVMGGTGCEGMTPFIERLAELNVSRFCDVVNMHPYSLAEPPEGEMLAKVRQLQAWRDQHAPNKPMWSTEFGWMTMHDRGVDQPTLRDYVVRSSILQLAHGQEVVLWCPGADRPWEWPWTFSGLYGVDFTPKETYVAFAALSKLLAGKRCSGSVKRGDGVFAYAFDGSGERVEALWSPQQTRQIQVKMPKPSVLMDVRANPITECAAGEVQVPVGPTPVFLMEQSSG